jgi:hypothetical protein
MIFHTSIRFILVSGIVAAIAGWPLARAELTWENPVVELTTKPGDSEAVAIFRFRNSGSTPVTILDLHACCSCTKVETAKMKYAAGESGEIKSTYMLAGQEGTQEKRIEVLTDDKGGTPYGLALRVAITPIITCLPRTVIWHLGDKFSAQTITLEAGPGQKIRSVEVIRMEPNEIIATVRETETGRKFAVGVTPSAAARASTTVALTLHARMVEGASHDFTVFALVR